MIEYFNVEAYEFLNPSLMEIDYLVGCAYDDCQNRYFHWFVYKCVFDINFIKINKKVIFQVTLGYGEFISDYEGLNVKIENIKNDGFIFDQTLK